MLIIYLFFCVTFLFGTVLFFHVPAANEQWEYTPATKIKRILGILLMLVSLICFAFYLLRN